MARTTIELLSLRVIKERLEDVLFFDYFKVGQAMERSGCLHRMNEHVGEITEGLNCVQALLQQKSPTIQEAENVLKVCM